MEFIRQNFFEILIAGGVTTAAIVRMLYPDIREREKREMGITDVHEAIIILYELLAIPIIFFTTRLIKNIYLTIYIVGCVGVSLYYLWNKSGPQRLAESKDLCIFPSDMKSIWYHLVYVYLLVYIVFIK
jgi:hypothetical protein